VVIACREIRVHLHAEFESLLLGDREKLRSTNSFTSVKRLPSHSVHLAGLDLRQIEHVVDEIEQIAARGENRLREFPPARVRLASLFSLRSRARMRRL